MPLFSVPATGTYRTIDGQDVRYFVVASLVDMTDAVRFQMPGAELPDDTPITQQAGAPTGVTASDTATIQACFDAGGYWILGEGTYLVDRPTTSATWAIQPKSDTVLWGRGVGKTIIKAANAAVSGVAVFKSADPCNDIEIAYMEVDGNRTARSAGVTAENEGINLKTPTRAWLHHLHIHDCGQDGIDIDDGTHVMISDNVIHDCGGGGIHLGGTTPNAITCIARNNIITNCGHERRAEGGTFGAFGGGVDAVGSGVAIVGNVSENCARGLLARGLANGIIANNVVLTPGQVGNGGPGIVANGGSGFVAITGNTIKGRSGTTGSDGVLLGDDAGVSRVTVAGNTITAVDHGVRFLNTCNDVLVNDNVIYSFLGSGVYAQGIVSGSIWEVNDNVIETGATGVRVEASQGLVAGNIIKACTNQSIDLRGPITEVAVLGNYVPSGTGFGIRFLSSGGTPGSCTVMGNDLAGTAGTLSLTGSGHIIKNNAGYVTENGGAAASVADGGTVTHGLSATPTHATAVASIAGEFVSVTALGATTVTVAIKKHDGTAGTSQTVYWRAYV